MSRKETKVAVLSVEPETGNQKDGEGKKRLKEGERDVLMVATTFIAAVAFQAGISPPCGVWQENSNVNVGKSIMATESPTQFILFMSGVTIYFACSTMQFTVLMLIKSGGESRSVSRASSMFLHYTMGTARAAMVIAYRSSVKSFTPHKQMTQIMLILCMTLGTSGAGFILILMYNQKKMPS